MSFARRKRKELQIVDAYLESLFNDCAEVQQRYQDREKGYLVKSPFVTRFFNEQNSEWRYFVLKWNKNPKKVHALNIYALHQKFNRFIDNQKQIAWMMYAINIFEKEYDYNNYNVAELQQLYKERTPKPEDAVLFMMQNLHWKIKLKRWFRFKVIVPFNRYFSQINFHSIRLNNAYA